MGLRDTLLSSVTGTAEAGLAGGGTRLGRRYEGEEALKLREAVQALCVHATAEE
jgi:hypothetical protein